MRHLVAERELRERGLEVTLGHRGILRLDHLPEHVDDVEGLREPHQVAIVLERGGALAALEIAHARRARDRREHDVPSTHAAGARGIAGDESDFRRDGRDSLADHAGLEAHHLARIVHGGPGRAQHRAPARRQHPHALVLENVERRAMHARDLIVGEDPHRLEGVDEVSVARRARLGCRGAGSLGFSPARSHRVKCMPPLAARRAQFPWPPLAR